MLFQILSLRKIQIMKSDFKNHSILIPGDGKMKFNS